MELVPSCCFWFALESRIMISATRMERFEIHSDIKLADNKMQYFDFILTRSITTSSTRRTRKETTISFLLFGVSCSY